MVAQDGQAISAGQNALQNPHEWVDSVQRILDGICTIIADVTSATTVVVARRNPSQNNIRVIGRFGTLINEVDMSFVLPGLNPDTSPTLAVPDLRKDSRFSSHPFLSIAPHTRSLMALLIPQCTLERRAVLKIVNPRRSCFEDAGIWRELTHFSNLISSVLEMDDAVATARLDALPKTVGNEALLQIEKTLSLRDLRGHEAAGGAQYGGSFLLDTLLKKRVLHQRNGVDYVTLRSWRGPMKPYQLAAFIALKHSKPPEFIRSVADEMASAAIHLHGNSVIENVVPIPGGSSGDAASFSVLLGQEIAARLDVPCRELLVSQGSRGRSSPHKSARIKIYESTQKVFGPTLVVDDVVSSGKHLEMAVLALRTNNMPVYAMAWIGKT